jgi:hypothetical protein
MLPTLMLVVLCLSVLLWARRGLWRLALLSLPGTLAHELAHLLVGTLMYAKPNSVSLFPRRSGKSYVLGSVSFRNVSLFNGAFVAFAPLLLAPVGYLCVLQGSGALTRGDYLAWSLWSVLAGNLFFSALPSWQDFKTGVPSLLMYSAIGIGVAALTGKI